MGNGSRLDGWPFKGWMWMLLATNSVKSIIKIKKEKKKKKKKEKKIVRALPRVTCPPYTHILMFTGEADHHPEAWRQRAAPRPGGAGHQDNGAHGGPAQAEHRLHQGRGQEGRALPQQGREDLQGEHCHQAKYI